MQIGLGSTVAVLYWLFPIVMSDFAEQNKKMREYKGLTPEEIEKRRERTHKYARFFDWGGLEPTPEYRDQILKVLEEMEKEREQIEEEWGLD